MAECAACGVEIDQDRILCESCAPAYTTSPPTDADASADATPARTSKRWATVAVLAVAFLLTLVALFFVTRWTLATSPEMRRLEVAADAVEASFTGDAGLMDSSTAPGIRALLAGTVSRGDRTLTRSWDGADLVLTPESGATGSPAPAVRLRGDGDGDGVVLIDEAGAAAIRFVFSDEGGETIVSDVQENVGGSASPVWKAIARNAP